jgi:hypothetical protein
MLARYKVKGGEFHACEINEHNVAGEKPKGHTKWQMRIFRHLELFHELFTRHTSLSEIPTHPDMCLVWRDILCPDLNCSIWFLPGAARGKYVREDLVILNLYAQISVRSLQWSN